MALEYSQADIEALFVSLYNGDIDPLALPEDLFLSIGKYLLGGTEKGLESAIQFGEADPVLVQNLKDNVYRFSAAKTFQQTVEYSDALFDGGHLRSFEDYKKAANEIYVRYNGGEIDDEVKPGWIEAEYNTAIAQAANAQKWSNIEKQKKTFPYLRYSATNSACDICAPLNNITLPVEHPFWDEYMPENHFNCNCVVEQIDVEEGEETESDENDINQAYEKNKIPEEFKFNAGKREEVFSETGKSQHPYFVVPKEYIKFAQKNFGLDIPE